MIPSIAVIKRIQNSTQLLCFLKLILSTPRKYNTNIFFFLQEREKFIQNF